MCIAVVHFNEIICCNTEVTNVLIVFENRIISLQPKQIAGCDTLLKRNIDTILLSNSGITFVISVLQQTISVKCTTAMHTGWRCPFKIEKWSEQWRNLLLNRRGSYPVRSLTVAAISKALRNVLTCYWECFYFNERKSQPRVEPGPFASSLSPVPFHYHIDQPQFQKIKYISYCMHKNNMKKLGTNRWP